MRRNVITLVVVGVLLVRAPSLWASGGHQEAGGGRSIDALIEKGLAGNPEIRQAQAKLEEAKAALNDARLRVTLQIVEAANALRVAVAEQEAAELAVHTASQRADAGVTSQSERAQAIRALAHAESDRNVAKARLAYLTGEGGEPAAGTVDPVAAPGMARSRWSDDSRRMAGQKLGSLHVDEKQAPLVEALRRVLFGAQPRLNIVVDQDYKGGQQPIDLELEGELTVAAVLAAVADRIPDVAFVFRDYGIYVTTRNKARNMRVPFIADDY